MVLDITLCLIVDDDDPDDTDDDDDDGSGINYYINRIY